MARLKSNERAGLPDRAFAYIDARGRRRLPIHDESHVRNALARFDRVVFEDEEARERARRRLLIAAKRFGILPVGFIDGQLRSARTRGSPPPPPLPTGRVTFLLTDIEGSTGLLRQLGTGYAGLLRDVRKIVRDAVRQVGGREVDVRADEYFAVFERPLAAVEAAVGVQRTLAQRRWADGRQCRVRAGVHTGRPTLTEGGYIGLSVHVAARICQTANGGQIVLSRQTRAALKAMPSGMSLRSLGRHRLQGMTRAEELFQLEAEGLQTDFPPLRATSRP